MRNLFHSVWFVCGGGGAGDRVCVETLSPPCSQQWQQEARQSDSRASKIDSIILDMWLGSPSWGQTVLSSRPDGKDVKEG